MIFCSLAKSSTTRNVLPLAGARTNLELRASFRYIYFIQKMIFKVLNVLCFKFEVLGGVEGDRPSSCGKRAVSGCPEDHQVLIGMCYILVNLNLVFKVQKRNLSQTGKPLQVGQLIPLRWRRRRQRHLQGRWRRPPRLSQQPRSKQLRPGENTRW